ncbi:metallophosphoesterase domain-containing protein 1 isoform X2 [Macaca fascicularis]|uniref:metallophosphoesterase domain-containing protein 1 isoform X2 n=1 Tax=Macaca fascicularis TaxID=9541 RepID=UPI001E25635B|nr:metallophosphoesterase domain-containing protein 1 isoform X2 [Macaca fascicularis]
MRAPGPGGGRGPRPGGPGWGPGRRRCRGRDPGRERAPPGGRARGGWEGGRGEAGGGGRGEPGRLGASRRAGGRRRGRGEPPAPRRRSLAPTCSLGRAARRPPPEEPPPLRASLPGAPASLGARCCSRPPRPPKRSPGPGSLPYEYKIVIAGNHELTFDQEFMADLIKQDFYYFPSVSKLKPENYENVQSLLTNCIYLQDSEVTVRGFRIYGSPWQPWFYGWGFNLPRGQALLEKWNLIPEGVDILITHGPPLGFLDWVPKKMQRVGCVELLNTVQRRVQPRLHVFGHIHEGYGVMADGTTTYVNASVCTVNYQPVNPPIVIDLPTPRNS